MILEGLKQDWETVGKHALFFAEIWWIIGVTFGLANKSFPSPWLATATTITLGCAGCLFFTLLVIKAIDWIQGKASNEK